MYSNCCRLFDYVLIWVLLWDLVKSIPRSSMCIIVHTAFIQYIETYTFFQTCSLFKKYIQRLVVDIYPANKKPHRFFVEMMWILRFVLAGDKQLQDKHQPVEGELDQELDTWVLELVIWGRQPNQEKRVLSDSYSCRVIDDLTIFCLTIKVDHVDSQPPHHNFLEVYDPSQWCFFEPRHWFPQTHRDQLISHSYIWQAAWWFG